MWAFAFAKQTPEKPLRIDFMLFLRGTVPHYIDYYVLNQELIDCLIKYESGWNRHAVGKAGEIGILQFLPATFQDYCVERYDYPDDIYNPTIQKLCAGEMIYKGGLRHWTTRHKCN